jgi:hypothetical protein
VIPEPVQAVLELLADRALRRAWSVGTFDAQLEAYLYTTSEAEYTDYFDPDTLEAVRLWVNAHVCQRMGWPMYNRAPWRNRGDTGGVVHDGIFT